MKSEHSNRTIYGTGRIFVGRLEKGEDLLGRLTAIANEEEIRLGTVQVDGYLSSLVLSRHAPEGSFPVEDRSSGIVDIVSCSGTISLFKRRSLPRLAGLFADSDGSLRGGTIRPGTTVHACEVVLTELTGGALSRDFDEETGLPLWKNGVL